MNVAHNERDSGFFAAFAFAEITFKTENAELAPTRGKVGLGDLLNSGSHEIIINSGGREPGRGNREQGAGEA
jgi:hypothetical protein